MGGGVHRKNPEQERSDYSAESLCCSTSGTANKELHLCRETQRPDRRTNLCANGENRRTEETGMDSKVLKTKNGNKIWRNSRSVPAVDASFPSDSGAPTPTTPTMPAGKLMTTSADKYGNITPDVLLPCVIRWREHMGSRMRGSCRSLRDEAWTETYNYVLKSRESIFNKYCQYRIILARLLHNFIHIHTKTQRKTHTQSLVHL